MIWQCGIRGVAATDIAKDEDTATSIKEIISVRLI